MQIVITKLIWDTWNTDHIKKHKVQPEEVEQSLQDIFVVYINGHSDRVMSLGRANDRLITTVLQQQKEEKYCYYVVTARDMSEKERTFYRKQKLMGGGEE